MYEIRFYLLLSLFLFICSFYFGYLLAQSLPLEAQRVIESIKSVFAPRKEISSTELFMFILGNNILKLSAAVFLGMLGGIVPLLVVFFNGFILGVLFVVVLKKASLGFFLLGILPHGIIEIPALIISCAVGFRLGKVAVFRIFSRKESFKNELYKGVRLYVFVLVPLLFIAALVEAFITLSLFSFFYAR